MNDSEDQSSKARRFSSAHKERAKGMIRERMGSRPGKKKPHPGDEVKKDYAQGQRPRQVQAPGRDEPSREESKRRLAQNQHLETIKELIQAKRARKQEYAKGMKWKKPHPRDKVKKDYAQGQRPRRVQAPGREEPSRGGERRFDQNQHRETIKERIQAMRARKQERRQERRQGRA